MEVFLTLVLLVVLAVLIVEYKPKPPQLPEQTSLAGRRSEARFLRKPKHGIRRKPKLPRITVSMLEYHQH